MHQVESSDGGLWPTTTVLSGFYFRTIGSNHNLQDLRVYPRREAGWVNVGYMGNDGNDEYTALVLYAEVPRPGAAHPDAPGVDGPFEEQFDFHRLDDRRSPRGQRRRC